MCFNQLSPIYFKNGKCLNLYLTITLYPTYVLLKGVLISSLIFPFFSKWKVYKAIYKYIYIHVFGRTNFSYSAVQPLLNNNFPWSLGYFRKFRVSHYFTPGFVFSQYMAPRNIKLVQTIHSYCSNAHL